MYLLYQTPDKILHKKEVNNQEQAQKIVDQAGNRPIKLNEQYVHIVGLGTEEDYLTHQRILGQDKKQEGPAFLKLKQNIAYYKAHGKWPE